MNVGKDVNNSVQKLKVYSQVGSKLNYANNAFNMELDILIVVLIMKKGNILENPENAGEYGRRIQKAEFVRMALAIGMWETPRDAGDLVGLQ